jgi:hypothetical protein
MKLNRPKTILLLIVVFAWSFLKGVELLFRGSSTADRILFDEIGTGWLAVTLLVVIAGLDPAGERSKWALIREWGAGYEKRIMSSSRFPDWIDCDRLAEASLAILSLTLHEGGRVWKGLDWDLMDLLHEKGWIVDPRSKAKSVLLTEEASD